MEDLLYMEDILYTVGILYKKKLGRANRNTILFEYDQPGPLAHFIRNILSSE